MDIPREETPNPHALKFCVSPAGSPEGPRSYRSREASAAAGDRLACALFDAGPVASVLILPGFVTVNKRPSARWARLTPKLEAVLREYLKV